MSAAPSGDTQEEYFASALAQYGTNDEERNTLRSFAVMFPPTNDANALKTIAENVLMYHRQHERVISDLMSDLPANPNPNPFEMFDG
jgi:FPC/CPF motif-containing protein YcgG